MAAIVQAQSEMQGRLGAVAEVFGARQAELTQSLTQRLDAMTGRIRIAPDIDYLEHAFDHAKYGRCSSDPYIELTIPTLLDPGLAPQGAHVLSAYVQFAPYALRATDWDREREALARIAIKAIEQLMEARTDRSFQRVQIISVLTDDNLDEMPKLCELARDMGVYWQVQPYSVMKTGNERQRHLAGATEMLLGLKDRYPDTVHSNRVYLEKFDQAANDGVDGCIAGKAMFNIDNRMVVSKCVEFNESEPVGNLRTDSMQQVLARLRAAHAANTCSACWYSCRGEVEVLYSARGFANSVPSLLWQSGGEQARTG